MNQPKHEYFDRRRASNFSAHGGHMHKTIRLIALSLLTLLVGVAAMAAPAQGQVVGTVTVEGTGEPLVSAEVFVEGTAIGLITDANGRFTLLNVPAGPQTIVARRLGYLDAQSEITVTAGTTTTVTLVLRETALNLDGFVVTGYGTQQRREVTGAVQSISGATIIEIPAPNLQTALQGRLAGVNVAESSGEPGAAPQIIIRGTGSISAGTEPLYVIDGVPFSLNLTNQLSIDQQNSNFGETRLNPLANINPNDIESIEVLKDAAAAAIYGSRGSNGVILITTKRGSFNQAPQMSLRVTTGVQNAFNIPEFMNAAEQVEYVKISRNVPYLALRDPEHPASAFYNPLYDPDTNAGREANGASGGQMIPEAFVNWDGVTDTDWIGEVLEQASLRNVDLSVRGGSSNFTYFVSSSYTDQAGIIDRSNFRRLGLRANLTMEASERLQLRLDFNFAYTDQDRVSAQAPYFGRPPGIIYSAMVASPVVEIYDDDGNYLQRGTGSINGLGNGMTSSNHPLAARDYITDEITQGRVFGSFSAGYAVRDNLRYNLLFGYDYDTNRRNFYQGVLLQYRGRTTPEPYSQTSSGESNNWLLENTMTYNGSKGSHTYSFLAGYTAQKQFDETSSIIARNFPDDQVTTINGGEVTGGSQNRQEWSLVSMLGRVNYTLRDRYLATFTFRSDRSSRFGKGNQTGYFPSVSVGWQMTEEPFMRGVDFFSQLKPRISYGTTGNFSIPNYGAIGLVSSDPYVFGDAVTPGATPQTLGNNELTWETSRQVNVGLDFGLLGDRIYGSVDGYVSKTEDLLLNVNVPSSTGFATALTNIGEVENKGFEAQITSRNVVGGFTWTTDFSVGANRNEVKALGPEGDPILSRGAAGVRHRTAVGGEVGAYFGYVHDGIYMTQADLDNAPIDQEGTVTLGNIRWKDINEDGFINADDRTEIGSYNPDFTWGLGNRFSWRDFDLYVFFNGVQGREILNLTRRHLTGQGNFNHYKNLHGNYYKSPEEPGNGFDHIPDRGDTGGDGRVSNYLVEDGSYISLKNVSLGWDVPTDLLQSLMGSWAPDGMRLYASVNNVFMWTDYWGWNPEASIQGNGLTPGQDYGVYPLMRAFQLGMDIDF